MCASIPSGITQELWDKLPDSYRTRYEKDPKFAEKLDKLSVDKLEEIIRRTINSGTTGATTKGVEVEKTTMSQLEQLKPTYKLSGTDDKAIREGLTSDWTAYFTARYEANPKEALRDYVRVTNYKDVLKNKVMLETILDPKNGKPGEARTLKLKYMAEGRATEEEQKAYGERMKELAREYKDPANRQKAVDAYNDMFKLPNRENPVDKGQELDDGQLITLIRTQALDVLKINNKEQIDRMAVDIIIDNEFSSKVLEANKYAQKIKQLEFNTTMNNPASAKLFDEASKTDQAYEQKIGMAIVAARTQETEKLEKKLLESNADFNAKIEEARKNKNFGEADALVKKKDTIAEGIASKIDESMDKEKLKEVVKLNDERNQARDAIEQKIYASFPDDVKKQIDELTKKKEEAVKEGNASYGDLYKKVEEKIPDLAKQMAETKVDIDLAKARVARTTVHWEDGKKSDDGTTRHTYLDDSMREYVKSKPAEFGDKVDTSKIKGFDQLSDEQKATVLAQNSDYVSDGVGYKFNSEKFKNKMVQMSNSNQIDNSEDGVDIYNKADMFVAIPERIEHSDDKKGAYGAKFKHSDSRAAKKCFKAAGLDYEKDKSFGKYLKHVFLKPIIPALKVGAYSALGNYLSTTKVVQNDFVQLLKKAQVVPVSLTQNIKDQFKGSVHVSIDEVKDAKWSLSEDINGVAEGDVDVKLSGTTKHTVDETFNRQGTTSGDVEFNHQIEQIDNGISMGVQNIKIKKNVNLPWEDSFNFKKTYDVPVELEGKVHAKVPYQYHLNRDGVVEVRFQKEFDQEWTYNLDKEYTMNGEVKVDREMEESHHKKEKMKMNWTASLYAMGAKYTQGVLANLLDYNKIQDYGRRRESEYRAMVADKNLDAKPVPTPAPESKPKLDSIPVTLAQPIKVDNSLKLEPEKCSATATATEKEDNRYKIKVGNMNLADLIRKHYGIKNSKDLYEAIGIIKSKHNIGADRRKTNAYIAELALEDTLVLSGGKSFNLNRKIDLKTIEKNNPKENKPGTYGKYKITHLQGGKVKLSCADIEKEYESFELAQKAAEYFNKYQNLLNNEEIKKELNKNK